MSFRAIGLALTAMAAVTLTTPVWADDSDLLPLPKAMAQDDLSKETARGDDGTSVSVQKLSSSASADASIDHVTIVGPSSTGGVNGLTDLLGATNAATLQISTGSGNIQQGVQAVALSF